MDRRDAPVLSCVEAGGSYQSLLIGCIRDVVLDRGRRKAPMFGGVDLIRSGRDCAQRQGRSDGRALSPFGWANAFLQTTDLQGYSFCSVLFLSGLPTEPIGSARRLRRAQARQDANRRSALSLFASRYRGVGPRAVVGRAYCDCGCPWPVHGPTA
mgnify:CR=1 FL=1